jgi:quercetin dioxygenase-like cupin family protein
VREPEVQIGISSIIQFHPGDDEGDGEKVMKAVHILASEAEKEKTAGQWGTLVWMANQLLSGSSVAVARLILTAGQSTYGQSGKKHRHPNADEVIYLFSGTVDVHVGEETTRLQPGDALTVPANLIHRIENAGSQDAEMTLSYSSGDREYVAE